MTLISKKHRNFDTMRIKVVVRLPHMRKERPSMAKPGKKIREELNAEIEARKKKAQ